MPSLICGLPLYRSTDVSEVRINRLPPEPDCIALCYRPTGKAHGYRHAVLSLPSHFACPLQCRAIRWWWNSFTGFVRCCVSLRPIPCIYPSQPQRLGAVGFLSPLPLSRQTFAFPRPNPQTQGASPEGASKNGDGVNIHHYLYSVHCQVTIFTLICYLYTV